MEATRTIEDVVARCLRLDAREAAQLGEIDMPARCTTLVIDRICDGGAVVELERMDDGRYAAHYCRVSTENQREDGFSEEEQLRRVIRYCVKRRWAFRVFNDASLSGGLPMRDPSMMLRVWRNKADTYRSVFSAVFLQDDQYRPEETQAMRQWLDAAYQHLLEGGVLGIGEDAHPHPVEPGGAGAAPRFRTRVKNRVQFRPALTLLLESLPAIHTLIVTDTSRLSRCEALSSEIADQLGRHGIRLESLFDAFISEGEDGPGAGLSARLLSAVAEFRLREAVLNCLRAFVTMLEKGIPFGPVPFWIQKNPKTGKAELKRIPQTGEESHEVTTVRRIVELYLRHGEFAGEGSFNAVAMALSKAGIPSPRGKTWGTECIRQILTNPALVGRQRAFGREWPGVYEPLMNEDRWQVLQAKIERRAREFKRPEHRTPHGYLLSGLLKCACGAAMVRQRKGNGTEQYRCNLRPSQKRALNHIQHRALNAADADAFFDRIMADYHGTILRAFLQGSESEGLKAEIAELQDRLICVKQGIKERLLEWQQRNTLEKNLILKQVFQPFQIIGEPPHEHLAVRLRTAEIGELPPIPIYARKFSNWRRTMGDPATWVQSLGVVVEDDRGSAVRVHVPSAEELHTGRSAGQTPALPFS